MSVYGQDFGPGDKEFVATQLKLLNDFAQGAEERQEYSLHSVLRWAHYTIQWLQAKLDKWEVAGGTSDPTIAEAWWRSKEEDEDAVANIMNNDARRKRELTERIRELRDALGICHAAMYRHDDFEGNADDNPAGACLLDFEAEREIALALLEKKE